jgi:ATP-dependent RNA/DNA helicase IGHMBP2
MKSAIDSLKDLQELLRIEREEDYLQYQARLKSLSIPEKKAMGVCWYPLVVTGTGFTMSESPYVEVERPGGVMEPHQFSAGKGVTFFRNTGGKNEEAVTGIIRTAGINNLKIILQTDDFPDWMDEGKLGVELLFDDVTYKEMDRVLKEVIKAQNNRLADLREILYNQKKPKFRDLLALPEVEDLNESQQRAAALVLSAEDVAVVHGPPGTGKTTTLTEAIRLTLHTEKQVLVVAPSNTAVDLLTEKLAELGINVLRIGNPARVSEELLRHTPEMKMAMHRDAALVKQLRKQASEYNQMARKYKRHFGKAEREQRKYILAEARKLSREAEDTERYMSDNLVKEAQVITCTPVGAVNRMLDGLTFSTVFIDEAGQALEPATWLPISRAERVVFAGDPFQLPPTVKSFEASKQGLAVSLMEKAITIPNVAVMLETQYRMHQDIMQFSNSQFYSNKLEAHSSVKEAVLPISPEFAQPLELVDTAGCGFEEATNPESRSTYNPEEADLVLKHLAALVETLEQNPATMRMLGRRRQIGIISPYKAQIEYFQQNLQHYPVLQKYERSISIGTVDGFQGQEREVIYISLVRSNIEGEIGFLADTRRMNVALTRAKKKLVVIGDSATLSGNAFYKHFFEYAEKAGAYKSAWEYTG